MLNGPKETKFGWVSSMKIFSSVSEPDLIQTRVKTMPECTRAVRLFPHARLNHWHCRQQCDEHFKNTYFDYILLSFKRARFFLMFASFLYPRLTMQMFISSFFVLNLKYCIKCLRFLFLSFLKKIFTIFIKITYLQHCKRFWSQ